MVPVSLFQLFAIRHNESPERRVNAGRRLSPFSQHHRGIRVVQQHLNPKDKHGTADVRIRFDVRQGNILHL